MSKTTLRDLRVIDAAMSLNAGISEDAIMDHAKRNGIHDMDEVLNDASTSKRLKQGYISDWLRASIEVLSPSYSGSSSVSAMLSEARNLEAEVGISASVGMATVSLSGVLGNQLNRALIDGYKSHPQDLRKICRVESVPDFRESTLYRVQIGSDLEKLGPGGEVKSDTIAETPYKFQVDTHAKLLTLPEEMIVNDSLGVLTEAGRHYAEASARTVEVAIASLLGEAINGATAGAPNSGEFFAGTASASRGANYLTGASTALSAEGALANAWALMRKQVDAKGNSINLEPNMLLTSLDNAILAKQLHNSTEVRIAGSADRQAPVANPFYQSFVPVSSPHLENAAKIAYPMPSTGYMLIHSSRRAAPVILAFRDGKDVPQVEFNSNPCWNQLAWSVRCRLDFGVSLFDPASVVYCAGA